jgi:ABC-type transport system involved in cytochrome bd biosynthesis fused ATPase/permease subunit
VGLLATAAWLISRSALRPQLTSDLLTAVAGRTVLLITHRPVDPATVDQVLRLTGGRVTPAGQVAPQAWCGRS